MTKRFRGHLRADGFSLVELLIATAIVVSVVTAASGAWQLYLRLSNQAAGMTQASLLAEEGVEAMNLLRDQGWAANIAPLSLDTPYYLYYSTSTYSYGFSASPVIIPGGYTRTVTLYAVNRDPTTYDITSTSTSCSSCDAGTRDALVSVYEGSSTVPVMEDETLIHNVFNN